MKAKTLEELIKTNGTGIVRGDFRLLASFDAVSAAQDLTKNPDDVNVQNEIKEWNLDDSQIERLKEISKEHRVYLSFNNQSLGSYSIMQCASEPADGTFDAEITLTDGTNVWFVAKYDDEDECVGSFAAYFLLNSFNGVGTF